MSRIAAVVEGISTVVSSNVVFDSKINDVLSFVGPHPVTNPLQDGVAFQLWTDLAWKYLFIYCFVVFGVFSAE